MLLSFAKSLRRLALLGCALAALRLQAQVVINEIFYRAPDDLTGVQWIELYNNSDQAVDLSGWQLAKSVKLTFAAGTSIAPHGYAIVCKDKKQFQESYQAPVVGEFTKSLKHSGRLELRNAANQVVDKAVFGNQLPWPRSADGGTASLERICPSASGELAENWDASELSDDSSRPAGTPGAKNGAFSPSLPPVIRNVTHPAEVVAPEKPVEVRADIESKNPLKQVTLLYRTVGPGTVTEEKPVPMTRNPGDKAYYANIPGQTGNQVVRFRILAVSQDTAQRFYPSPTAPRPALSYVVLSNAVPGKIPVGYFFHADPEDAQSALRQAANAGHASPMSPEGQGRFMAQMAFNAASDLPSLWASLTLGAAASENFEKLRETFVRQQHEVELLKEKTLASGAEIPPQKIPEIIKPLRESFGNQLKPLLTAEQMKLYESWREARPGHGDPRMGGNDPAAMLRQFIPLEAAYLHLSLSTNISAQQIAEVRKVYQDGLQQRDALLPTLRKLLANQGPQSREDGEKLQAEAEAIPERVDKNLARVLTPAQVRQLFAWQLSEEPSFMHHTRKKPPEPMRGQSAFVLVDPGSNQTKLFDFVQIPERSGGWKVHFGKDQSWNDMSTLDLIFEASDRWLLAEPLAYELYRGAGVAACRTDFVRLVVDGHPAGYYLLIEQVNKAFLRHNGLPDDGNLYKANWTGNGLKGQNEKHTNRHSDHEDLVQLVDNLEKTKDKPDEQWAVIRREFNLEQVLTHYAVRLLISDWDGFFNNYFLYHDLQGTKKWTLYPWDEDKTWGEYDGWEQEGTLYNLPLTYGAEGDHPPGEAGGRASNSYGFRQWWRAGGYISRPLLANPICRKYLLARIKELLASEFTQDKLFPLVDGYHNRLLEEVRYRARLTKEDPDRAQKRFESNLASLKEFIGKRREWLLAQEEIRTAGSFDRSELK